MTESGTYETDVQMWLPDRDPVFLHARFSYVWDAAEDQNGRPLRVPKVHNMEILLPRKDWYRVPNAMFDRFEEAGLIGQAEAAIAEEEG